MLKAFSAARRLLDASAAAGRAPSPSAGRAAQLRADTAALFRLLPRRPGGRYGSNWGGGWGWLSRSGVAGVVVAVYM